MADNFTREQPHQWLVDINLHINDVHQSVPRINCGTCKKAFLVNIHTQATAILWMAELLVSDGSPANANKRSGFNQGFIGVRNGFRNHPHHHLPGVIIFDCFCGFSKSETVVVSL